MKKTETRMTRGVLGLNFDLVDQLSFYGSYHANPWNQLIHFFFVPLILWSVGVWSWYIPFQITTPISDHVETVIMDHSALVESILPSSISLRMITESLEHVLVLNGAFILISIYVVLYIAMDPLTGSLWTLLVGIPLWATANAFGACVENAWMWALGTHVLGWFMQIFFGHKLAEKRKPALMDSFIQSLLLAPLFVFYEPLFALGYRPKLFKEIQKRVGANIRKWKAEMESKSS